MADDLKKIKQKIEALQAKAEALERWKDRGSFGKVNNKCWL